MFRFTTIKDLLELRSSISLEPDEALVLGEHSKIIGTFDSHEIWMSRDFSPDRVFAICTPEKVCRAFLIVDEESTEIDGEPFYGIEKIYVRPEDRRKGMGSSLIEFCVLKLEMKLRSGSTVSRAGRDLLRRLVQANALKFKAYNPSTKSVIAVPDDLFTNLNTETQLLIVESLLDDRRMFESRLLVARSFLYIDGTYD
jgi:GNAT superfamily N-acetyltransferase